MSVLAEGGAFLQDGFQEVLSYSGHKLQVRGVSVVELSQDSSSSSTGKNDVFIRYSSYRTYSGSQIGIVVMW